MARSKRTITDQFPYHVTARCINRNWFRLPLSTVWEVFENYLYLISFSFNVKIHSFVLMPNHFHLLISTPNANLSQCMNYFMTQVSRAITQESGRINQTFGGPYYASVVDNYHYYLHAYKYVYRNPVEAKLCRQVEEYPYSSLHGLIGAGKLIIPVIEDETLFKNFEDTLTWLNENYKDEHKEQIRKALRRAVFRLPKDTNKNASELELQKS